MAKFVGCNEVLLYQGSFCFCFVVVVFFLSLGLRNSFVIPKTSLYRGSLYRGSTVPTFTNCSQGGKVLKQITIADVTAN